MTLPQHPGSAVVNNGVGLHMPDETHDLPAHAYEQEAAEEFASMEEWAIRCLLVILCFITVAIAGVLAGFYVGR